MSTPCQNRCQQVLRAATVTVATLAALMMANVQSAGQGRPSHVGTVSAAGDFEQDGLRFHRLNSGFIQVVDIKKNATAGTVMFPGGPDQPPMFAPMPGYDIQAAYEKHTRGDDQAAAPKSAGANAPPATTGAAPAAKNAGFDAASKTVALSGGRSVTFTDAENLKVQMPGPAGIKIYDLHFHGAGAGGFVKGWAGREQGRVGGSLGGGGVTMSLEAQNGMPGGEVYDTAKGTVYGNSGVAQAKTITAAVRKAVDVVKTEQPELVKLKVVKSLLSNNLGL